MEELVSVLAELQDELDKELIGADFASANIDKRIAAAKEKLSQLEKERDIAIKPYIEVAEELKTTIANVQQTIIDAWDGEKKTVVYNAGTLKFQTTQSLEIRDRVPLMYDLAEHLSLAVIASDYISGFNKTTVKKYMTVHSVSPETAILVPKTTVKLEQKSG